MGSVPWLTCEVLLKSSRGNILSRDDPAAVIVTFECQDHLRYQPSLSPALSDILVIDTKLFQASIGPNPCDCGALALLIPLVDLSVQLGKRDETLAGGLWGNLLSPYSGRCLVYRTRIHNRAGRVSRFKDF